MYNHPTNWLTLLLCLIHLAAPWKTASSSELARSTCFSSSPGQWRCSQQSEELRNPSITPTKHNEYWPNWETYKYYPPLRNLMQPPVKRLSWCFKAFPKKCLLNCVFPKRGWSFAKRKSAPTRLELHKKPLQKPKTILKRPYFSQAKS